MGKLASRVTDVIRLHLTDAVVELDEGQTRLHGRVVTKAFADKEQIDRQSELRSMLRNELGPDYPSVGIRLTYTPDELHVMQAT